MRRFLAVVLVAVGLILGGAAVANAQAAIPTGTDCLRPPTPASPNDGLAGWIDPGPTNPPTGDPFAKDATVSIYSQYGYAGLEPVEYDPGCASIWSWHQLGAAASNIAAVITAVTVRLYRLVMSGTFGSLFDGIQAVMSNALGMGLFVPLISLGLACTGLYFLSRARKADLAGESKTALVSALIVVGGVAAIFYPFAIGSLVDKGITTTITSVNQLIMPAPAGTTPGDPGTAGDMIAANVHASVLYQTWRQQTFGPDGEQAADEFGPRLFAASAFNRTEQATITADPSKAADMIKTKKDQYKAIAREVETKYPQAYTHLAGAQSLTTLGLGVMGLLAVVLACGFLIYSLWKFAYALVVARVGIGVAPVVALIAQFPRFHHHAMTLLGAIASAAMTAVVFGVAAIAYLVAGIGKIMDPSTTWHPVGKMLAMLVLTVVLLRLLKKFKMAAKVKGLRGRGITPTQPVGGQASQVAATAATTVGAAAVTGAAMAPPSTPEANMTPKRAPRDVPITFDQTQQQPSRVKGAIAGATQGAATTAAAGALTGGTVTAGAVAAGAAKGAAGSSVAPRAQAPNPPPMYRTNTAPPSPAGSLDAPAKRVAIMPHLGTLSPRMFHLDDPNPMPGPKTAAPENVIDGKPIFRVTNMDSEGGW